MNTLYPIIRRKRRPLITPDVPPVAAVSEGREDGKTTAGEQVRPAKAPKSKSHDDAAED